MQALGPLLPLDDFCPVRWASLSNTPGARWHCRRRI